MSSLALSRRWLTRSSEVGAHGRCYAELLGTLWLSSSRAPRSAYDRHWPLGVRSIWRPAGLTAGGRDDVTIRMRGAGPRGRARRRHAVLRTRRRNTKGCDHPSTAPGAGRARALQVGRDLTIALQAPQALARRRESLTFAAQPVAGWSGERPALRRAHTGFAPRATSGGDSHRAPGPAAKVARSRPAGCPRRVVRRDFGSAAPL